MPVELVVAFWAVSALFVVRPDADWAYAITAGLQHRSVPPAVGGMLAGHLAATDAVAAGGGLLSRAPGLLTPLTLTAPCTWCTWASERSACPLTCILPDAD